MSSLPSVAEGFDAGIRLGEALRSGMESLSISSLAWDTRCITELSCLHGESKIPQDLRNYQLLNFRLSSGRTLPWEFQRGDVSMVVSEVSPFSTNDSDLLIEAAIQGCGIAQLTQGTVDHHLQSGRLVALLKDWSETYPG